MQFKILATLSKQTLLVIIIVEFFISSGLSFYLVSRNSNKFVVVASSVSRLNNKTSNFDNNIVIISKEVKASFGLPIRLKIPAINVDSAIESVGLTTDGAMDVPKKQDDVAWFQLGQRPGENGSAVIAGHYGWKSKKKSAFDNLHKLRAGDKVYVEDGDGYTIIFVVSGNKRYLENANSTEIFNSNDGKAHLNLITCEGEWNKVSKSYPNRLVIFADKE